jgi:hypothetical protein
MSPVLTLANVLEKQEVNLILGIITGVANVISIVIGGLLGNVYVALGLLSLLNGLA